MARHIWTEEEDNFLKEQRDKFNVEKESIRYELITEALNKKFGIEATRSGVHRRMYTLGISFTPKYRVWTEEETEFIRDNYNKFRTTSDFLNYISKELNLTLTVEELRYKLKCLKLKLIDPHIYTEEQKQFIIDNADIKKKKLTKLFNDKFGTDLSSDSVATARFKYAGSRDIKLAVESNKKNARIVLMYVDKRHPLYSKLYKYRTQKKNLHNKITVCRSIYNWISAGNEIPDGYILLHIDGNSLNDDLSNLRCVSRSTAMKVRSFGVQNGTVIRNLANYPAGFNDAILEMIKFNDKVGK